MFSSLGLDVTFYNINAGWDGYNNEYSTRQYADFTIFTSNITLLDTNVKYYGTSMTNKSGSNYKIDIP